MKKERTTQGRKVVLSKGRVRKVEKIPASPITGDCGPLRQHTFTTYCRSISPTLVVVLDTGAGASASTITGCSPVASSG